MKSPNSQIEQLRLLLSLEEKRVALQNQLGALDSQIKGITKQLVAGGGSSSAPAAVAKAPAAPGRRRGRKPSKPVSTGRSAAPAAPKTRGGGRKAGGRRGALQARMIDALRNAGSGGITVKALSEKLRMPYRNVQVWFATTGKKDSGIRKIAPATYRYAG